MNIQWRRHRLAAWLACFAVLLAALAPSISHAVSALKGNAAWVEVCTAAGTALVQVPTDQTPDQAPAQPAKPMTGEHCVFCGSHAGSFALPASDVSLTVPSVSGKDLPPTLYYRAPRPLFAWSAGQPRAPPALS